MSLAYLRITDKTGKTFVSEHQTCHDAAKWAAILELTRAFGGPQ